MMSERGMIVIRRLAQPGENQPRLCQDGKWRFFAMFGSEPCCVLVFKNRVAAATRAKKLQQAEAVELAPGYQMDAVGGIFDNSDTDVSLSYAPQVLWSP